MEINGNDLYSLLTKIKKFEKQGLGNLPICVAKTEYSLSVDATLLGRPEGFKIEVMYVILNNGIVSKTIKNFFGQNLCLLM